MYLAIEGIDTAGKSTQIDILRHEYQDAIITKEPGGTVIGARIRAMLLEGKLSSSKAEFLLFLADRAEHMQCVIQPNLNKLIISDRCVVSGVAYAMVKQDIERSTLISMNRFATDEIFPDMIFLLELTPKALSERLSQKELDGIESRGINYLLNIQSALIEAALLLEIPLIKIDATLPIEAISQQIIATVNSNLSQNPL